MIFPSAQRQIDALRDSMQALSVALTKATQEFQAHITFCTEREAKRDKEHEQNLSSLGAMAHAIGKTRGWVVGLVLSIGAAIIGGLIFALAWMVVYFVIEHPAHGAPPSNTVGDLAPWYQSLRQPGTGTSCCALADCRPTDYRIGVAGYEAKWGREWIEIPDRLVLQHTPNPTGRAVLCARDDGEKADPKIYCFVPSNET